MRLIAVLIVSLSPFVPNVAQADKCGATSCLTTRPNPDGIEIRIRPINPSPHACFIRWENYHYIEMISLESKPYLLKDKYDLSGVRWRCDDARTCPNWMKDAGLCKN
ncbi:hypothetical protein Q4561_07655 [Alteromonas sp. 1_MG-2023]|uniref:hypothetical protein n=1 Tax=Alteromonas sp. 1_MG-2023 TaxID=3062669 RepID=UPI0026E45FD4|nr:hypothetical protein [Alteromonas sp. 1_MG-2023]MDO6566931.1 hypothetical protein [Alteromonas sp. 1_MG-2023]